MLSTIIFRALIAISMLPIHIFAFPAKALEAAARNPDIASKAKAAHEKRRATRRSPPFNPAQIIDVSGEHLFVPPGPTDLRGPCPGLNALANHNFLPHNGFATISQLESANEEVFGMGKDLAAFLTLYGLVMDGNPLSLNPGWSIGGPSTQGQNVLDNLLGVLGPAQGLIGSHNKYEGDASPTRCDLYVCDDSSRLQISQFQDMFDLQPDPATANYDIGIMAKLRKMTFERSIEENPYFFYGPFVGMAVDNAAHSFIYRFMANHTAESQEGILDQFNIKSFFGITGVSGAFQKKDGWERIPFGWGRRAFGDEYSILDLVEDITYFTSEYPNAIAVGGNTGTVNSFTGIDFSDLTGGVYSSSSLLEGNNLACFILQSAQFTPDFLQGLGLLENITGELVDLLGSCPELAGIDHTQMQAFPGSGTTL
ncbi:hypothetical protein NHQ30_003357 [Ciborinia camelliae]|nr:hypothetical protein NHQ30_003357 [Ciborinia camelliae]